MPIYEYTCKSCNTKFEKLLRTMNGNQKVECPKCGSTKTGRDFSVFAVGADSPKSGGHAHGPGCGCCASADSCPMRE